MIKSRQHTHISSSKKQSSTSHETLPHKHVSLTAVIASLMLPMAAQAVGQSSSAITDPQKASPAKQEQQLKEVQVLGQTSNEFKSDKAASSKYAAPLLDTPQTITVIKRELIEQQAAVNLSEALAQYARALALSSSVKMAAPTPAMPSTCAALTAQVVFMSMAYETLVQSHAIFLISNKSTC